MKVWWLSGYLDGQKDLWYPMFTTFGEARAHQEQQKLIYPKHNFILERGEW